MGLSKPASQGSVCDVVDRNLSQMEPWSYQTFKMPDIQAASVLLLGKGPQRAFLNMGEDLAFAKSLRSLAVVEHGVGGACGRNL